MDELSAPWRFYLKLYRGSLRTVGLCTALTLTQVALTLPIAILLSRLFNNALLPTDSWKIGIAALELITLYVIGDGFALIANHLSLGVTKSVILRLRLLLIEGIYRSHRAQHPADESTRIHAAIVHDTERVDVMSNNLLSRALPSLLSSFGMLAILAGLSWRLFLIAVIVVPASWFVARLLRHPLRKRNEQFRKVFDDFSAGTFVALQRQDLARIQGAENAEVATLTDHSLSVRNAGHRVAWIGFANSVAQGEAAVITGILVLLAGGALIASGVLTVGMLIAFYFALGLFRSNLSSLFGQLPSLVAGHAALEHLYPLIQTSFTEIYQGTDDIAFCGEVALNNVSFHYGKTQVLANATMVARRGEVTALAGTSGAGKTTVINLILGLLRPDDGGLEADGRPYESIKLEALRAKIGYAMQDPIIFAATARDNLAFGTDGAESHFPLALDIVGASKFVSRLPEGLETWLGEKGALLSGGQRQRLSIARAVLRRPALLILDEPTNHLGASEVKTILARFRAAFPRAAVLVISHDPDILLAADKLYTLEAGTIRPAAPIEAAKFGLVSGHAAH